MIENLLTILATMDFGEKIAVGVLIFFAIGGFLVNSNGGSSSASKKHNSKNNTGNSEGTV